MKLKFLFLNKPAIFIACENENTEIINLLLNRKDIDLNTKTILNENIF